MQRYKGNQSEDWLRGEWRRLQRIANQREIQHDIEVEKTDDGANFTMYFRDVTERDRFRLHAFADGAGHERFYVTVLFDDDESTAHREAWIKAVAEELDMWAVRYRLDRSNPNGLKYFFDDQIAADEFRRQCDSGFFFDLVQKGHPDFRLGSTNEP